MALARLVVIDGPDLGRAFDVPMRGGWIGRGEGAVVQLSDPAVSRQHSTIELRDGALCLVDDGSKNRTLVNGQPVTVHRLVAGDEIMVGKTRLAFVPADGGVAVTRQAAKVTMEVGSDELLSLAAIPTSGSEARARRHLASIAGLGDRLRAEQTSGAAAVAAAAGPAGAHPRGAARAFVLMANPGAPLAPIGAHVAPGDPLGNQLDVSGELIERVLRKGKSLTSDLGTASAPRAAAAVPLGSGATTGLLWVERRGAAWDQLDLMALACIAHVVAAALAGADARDQLARGQAALEERLGDGDFVGQSPAARALMGFVARVGPTDATVLLTGESGSGKEMVARAIHRASKRRAGPCVAVNCAALTESLVESELFGHEKGAFTGATERKLGRFELADKGTLFLDEVGELPLALQTKFLRVLEEQTFDRVGGTRPITVDVRVVAATNRDLSDMVRRGAFREDLFYRLSVIHTQVPPLRERPEDIALLADHFLARFRASAGRKIVGFTTDAKARLAAHPWPGNVRELRNAIERAVVLGDGEWVKADDLPPQLAPRIARRVSTPTPPLGSMAIIDPGPARSSPAIPVAASMAAAAAAMSAIAPPPSATPPADAPARSLRELEKDGIVAALAATGGNKAQAAVILEIDRSTLYKKLKEYGLDK
ncbi:MAG: sigma 54-interacting transcriptional regulator [Deltaproteobacteria bacterium]|nr:sigma 54-interacting transcriptional regulator [Deltaproteobacteria bacterium]